MTKKIAMIIAFEGFQPTEYQVPRDRFVKAGFQVVTVSDQLGIATARDGFKAKVEATLDDFNPRNYDGLVWVGGPGCLEHLDNDKSYRVLQEAIQANIPVGAICIAPRILAKAGILIAKTATCWNKDGLMSQLWREHGVLETSEDVYTDGIIVTASGPQVADIFADHLLKII